MCRHALSARVVGWKRYSDLQCILDGEQTSRSETQPVHRLCSKETPPSAFPHKEEAACLTLVFATADGVCPFGNPGRNFDLSARLPITLMMLAVAVTFSPALPVLFPMLAVYLVATYFGDKFYLLRACCTPPQVRSQRIRYLKYFEQRCKPQTTTVRYHLYFGGLPCIRLGNTRVDILGRGPTRAYRLGHLGA